MGSAVDTIVGERRLLTHPFYVSGGSFYWRVAARDKNFNLGDWTQAQQFTLATRLRVSVNRYPVRNRLTRMTVTVLDSRNSRVARAMVRVSGPGVRPQGHRTNSRGQALFKLRPRKRGRLLFVASKAGYSNGSLSIRVG